ncbi:unnamed protein product [Toxocara canis]|uniref:Uncharacterized protein n=1 Tax=Toxocara canis TaxID=6265 RepID=A0A183TZ84_TOXCA|nr:unnamed protein product [Toxocara canis]
MLIVPPEYISQNSLRNPNNYFAANDNDDDAKPSLVADVVKRQASNELSEVFVPSANFERIKQKLEFAKGKKQPLGVQAESVPNIISRSSEGLAQSGALNNENRVAIASQIGDIILPVSRRLYRRQVRSGQGFYAELQKTLDNRRSKMSGQLTLREALSIIQPNLIQGSGLWKRLGWNCC